MRLNTAVPKKFLCLWEKDTIKIIPSLQKVHRWKNKEDKRAHAPRREASNSLPKFIFDNDPSAGSPTETLLRLLLPLNDQV